MPLSFTLCGNHINNSQRNQSPKVSSGRLSKFMEGFAATVQLIGRAADAGCFVEYVCLSASAIDAMLRIGLILKHQVKTCSDDVLEELLYQSYKDKIISEREIYRRALAQQVIDAEIFDDLQQLYSERNRVVHRYIISDITTKEILNTAISFAGTLERVTEIVRTLEEKQLEIGVGMVESSDIRNIREEIDRMIRKKHGSSDLHKRLKRSSKPKNSIQPENNRYGP